MLTGLPFGQDSSHLLRAHVLASADLSFGLAQVLQSARDTKLGESLLLLIAAAQRLPGQRCPPGRETGC